MSNSKESQKRDEVLKRLLKTPPKPHKPIVNQSKSKQKTGGSRRQPNKR